MKPLDRITGYAHVALRYGLEESIFLDSLMFWYKENRANQRNFRDGRWWTFNTVSAFVAMFPWWSGKQIRRIIASCKERGAILSGNYNEDQRDRTLWYTPSDELLELYGLCQKEEVHLPIWAAKTAQMGKCNKDTCYNHEKTRNPLPPNANSQEGVAVIFDEYAGGDRELRQRLADFQESRQKIKKPLHTQRAAKIFINKLDKLSGGDRVYKLALLDNAILHSWESVYPLKPDELPQAANGPAGQPVLPDGGKFI